MRTSQKGSLAPYMYMILILSLVLASSCDDTSSKAVSKADSTIQESPLPIPDYPEIKYNFVEFSGSSSLDDLLATLPDSIDRDVARKILRTLNRKELRFMRPGDSIVIPEYFTNNLLDFTIFPRTYEAGRHIEKIILADIAYQAYACYENGIQVRWAAVNSGKERTPSFPGRYSLVWKQRLRKSSLDSTWELPFTFNFHSEAGSAFHQFAMPGRPVSHSCLRQFMDDAEWLYNWGKGAKYDTSRRAIPMTGTPVILLNHFDYSRRKGGPWLDLKSNKAHFVSLPDDPMAVEEALIPIIQIPKTSRGSLRNRERYVYAEDTLRARGVIRPDVVLTPSVDFNLQRRMKKAAEHKKKLEEERRLKEANPDVEPTGDDYPNNQNNLY